MSAGSSRELMDEYLSALQSRGEFARYMAEDVTWTAMDTGDVMKGRDNVRDAIVAMHTQTFDAQIDVKKVAVDEDGAILELELVGTHTGEFAGIPATGAKVRVPYAVAYDLSPDGITALRSYIPMTQMINQLREAQPAAVPAG